MLRKALRKSVLVGLTVLSTMSYASVTDLQANVKLTGEKSFALFLNGLSTNVQIVLKDQEGRTLYKEQVEDVENFAKNFNLNNLSEGSYSLKIEDAVLVKSMKMLIDGGMVAFGSEENTFKPMARTHNTKVKVAMASMNDDELNVIIRNNYDEVVFEEVVTYNEKGMSRIYDMSKIKAGDYTFVFHTNGYTFVQPVNIKK